MDKLCQYLINYKNRGASKEILIGKHKILQNHVGIFKAVEINILLPAANLSTMPMVLFCNFPFEI